MTNSEFSLEGNSNFDQFFDSVLVKTSFGLYEESNKLITELDSSNFNTCQQAMISSLRALNLSESGSTEEALKLSSPLLEDAQQDPSCKILLHLMHIQILLKMRDIESVAPYIPILNNLMENTPKSSTYYNYINPWYNEILGIYYRYSGDMEKSKTHLTESISLSGSLNMDYRKLQALNHLAFLNQVEGDFEKSVELLNECLDISDYGGASDKLKAGYFINLGYILWQKGNLDGSLQTYDQAINLIKNFENRELMGIIKLNKGLVYIEKIHLESAKAHLLEAKELLSDSSNKVLVANVYNNLGIIYDLTGELQKSMEFYKSAENIYENVPKSVDSTHFLARTKHNIGILLRRQNQLERSKKYLMEAVDLFEVSHSPIEMVSSNYELLIIYLNQDDIDGANYYLSKIEELKNSSDEIRIELLYRISKAEILGNSSRLINRVEAQKILNTLIESEIVSPDLKIHTMLNLCELLLNEFKVTESRDVLVDIAKLLGKLTELASELDSILLNLEISILESRLLLIKGDIDGSSKILEESLVIAQEHNMEHIILKIKSEELKLQKDIQKWEDLLHHGVSILEIIRKSELERYIDHVKNSGLLHQFDQ